MNPRDIEQIGPYPVVEFLAEGGMAWVFKVEDPKFHVYRALKMLKPQAAQGDEFRRFESEAKLLARIDHPNLVTIFDLGQDDQTGCLYYTMTFVDGAPLSDGDPLRPDAATSIFLDVLSALERLHLEGIVHRDVKPGNILVMSDGRVLLGDLGIAREQDSLISLTRTGMALGSVQYMSPEQARGEPVSPASDVFSVGLSLYQVLTGETIYEAVDEVDASSGEQVLMYLGALLHSGGELSFRFPRSVPRPLQRVVERACRFDPEQRYPDAGAVRMALLEARHAARAPVRGGKRRSWRGLAVAALLALAAAGGWYGWQLYEQRAPETPPIYRAAIEQIRDPGVSIGAKRSLVAQMGADRSAGATGALLAASADGSPQVAVDAVKFLSARMDERVAAQLIALLDSPEFTVRAWAARGLGEAGWRPARPALEARLTREVEAPVQRQLQQAIERLASPAASPEVQ
jgi:hypothetical protein